MVLPLLVCNLCDMKLMPSDSYEKILVIMILYHVNYVLTKKLLVPLGLIQQ
jgi:hypothetical protein